LHYTFHGNGLHIIIAKFCGECVFGEQQKKLCQGKAQPKHHNKTHLLSVVTLTQATTSVMHD